MKRLVTLIAVFGLLASARAEVELYNIDPVHSSAGFSIRHVFTNFTSSFTKVTGTITVDRANLENSSVEASIAVASLNTANANRDKDLQSPRFFDTVKFPVMTFKSKAWKKTGENTFAVTGDLTIRDVTKEVVLKVTSLGFGPGMMPGTFLSGWEATMTLARADYGITVYKGALGDDVQVTINVEADLKK